MDWCSSTASISPTSIWIRWRSSPNPSSAPTGKAKSCGCPCAGLRSCTLKSRPISLLVGANVTMLASALLLHGVGRLHRIETDLLAWLEEHEYESVAQLRGSMSQRRVPDPAAFERAQYIRTVGTFPLAVPRR